MNHPDREAWIPYLFGEADPGVRDTLEAHLRGCEECRARVETWRASLKQLDLWTIPARRRAAPTREVATLWRWAAVVVLSVSAGALGGAWAARRTTSGPVQEAVTSAAAGMTEAQVRALVDAAVVQERTALRDALEQVRGEQAVRLFELRRDLETVAATTDVALRQARRGLLEVAGYRPGTR